MSGTAIFLLILSIIPVLISVVPGNGRLVDIAQYILLIAILVEVGCIHRLWEERK